MPAPATAYDFLDLVRRSDLVDEAALDTYLGRLDPATRALEPVALAKTLIRDGIITVFQAEQFLQGKCKGMILGNYRVLERLGSGGMALVYLCEHRHMQRRVALKVLPTNNAKDAEYLKRFYREARAAAALEHANIVRAFDVDQDESKHFLVMEYVEGALLYEIVRQFGPMAIERAAHYVSQAAHGLQHIHEAGLIHRDIKPDNLIVDRAGTVKILDLGLARFQQSDEILTRGILGTPDYLSPEQCQDSHNVDIRSDIYSLGGTLYFLLAGRPPFPEGTVAEKFQWHQSKQPRAIRADRPEVPADLEMVVAVMMAKDPADRYQTPVEVAEALAPWTGTPIPPPAEAELPRLSPKARGELDTDANLAITPAVHTPRPRTPPPLTPPPASRPKPPPPPPAKAPSKPVLSRPSAPPPLGKTPTPPPRPAPPAEPAPGFWARLFGRKPKK